MKCVLDAKVEFQHDEFLLVVSWGDAPGEMMFLGLAAEMGAQPLDLLSLLHRVVFPTRNAHIAVGVIRHHAAGSIFWKGLPELTIAVGLSSYRQRASLRVILRAHNGIRQDP